MLYPQNGDRIVTIDSVTSLQPTYLTVAYTSCARAPVCHIADHYYASGTLDFGAID